MGGWVGGRRTSRFLRPASRFFLQQVVLSNEVHRGEVRRLENVHGAVRTLQLLIEVGAEHLFFWYCMGKTGG